MSDGLQPVRLFFGRFESYEAMIAHYRSLPPEEIEAYEREREEQSRREATERRRRDRVEIARRLSHISERFADRTFANYNLRDGSEAALRLAQLIAEDPSTGGWFFGDEGLGKTHLVAAIAHVYIERGISCPFVSTVRLYDDIKRSYDDRGETRRGQEDIITRLASMESLILDDLDKPIPTPGFTERMYRLINDRYEAKRPIIVTSNYDPADIGIAWEKGGGKRGMTAIDRLIEMCKKSGETSRRFVHLKGESLRGNI